MAATKYTISAAGSIGPFLAFRWDNPSLRTLTAVKE